MENHNRSAYPNLTECQQLWTKYETPEHVILHCKAVSHTAVSIAERMNEKGFHLNILLLQSAGWLHDILRTKEQHWERGAEVAEELGCFDMAEVIRVHMQYRIDSQKPEITETDLLCLADRTVKEDRYVGPDERMEDIIQKAKSQPEAEGRIRASFHEIRALKQRIESIIGVTLEEMLCSE